LGNWNNVATQADIDNLLECYGDFHDSCIVSATFRSGAFVDDTRAMHFGDASSCELHIVFESQWYPKTIELCFTGLRQFHLIGWQDNYSCDISCAYLAFHRNLLPGKPEQVVVWADTDWFDVNKVNNAIAEPADTYIVANALKWRVIEDI